MYFPTCQVVKNRREQRKSGAKKLRAEREEEEGSEEGEGRVSEVIVVNIFQVNFEEEKEKHF